MADGGQRPLPGRLDPRLGRAARPRSSRATTVARLVCGLLSVLLLAGCGWGWYLVRVAQGSVSRTDAIPTSGNSDVNGAKHAGQEMNLLLVGMDSRAGLTPQQRAEYSTGDPDPVMNTDTMMLVHIPADGSAASFVSFPRDMYVAIPGYGKGKLNSAYAYGYNSAKGDDTTRDAAGAQLLIRTISQLSGLQIDHFAEVNLLGFINLSTIVGGVTVNLCRATYDPVTKARFPAGVQTLSGPPALLFVRQRHGIGSDLNRVVRQQVYIAGMLRNLLSSHLLLDLSKQKAIVKQVGSSVTLDRGLDVFDLAAQMQSVQPGNITFQTIPGLTDERIAKWGDILQPPSQSKLEQFFATLTSEPAAGSTSAAPTSASAPKTVAPGSVTVQVLNGSGRTGAAAAAASALATGGFKATNGGNAPSTATTTIRYAPGGEARAATLAGQVPGAAQAADAALPAGTVRLVIGTDFNGIGKAVGAAPTNSPSTGTSQPRTAADTSCIS